MRYKWKKATSASGPFYTVKRVYRVHGTNRCLKKLTAYIMGRAYFIIVMCNCTDKLMIHFECGYDKPISLKQAI